MYIYFYRHPESSDYTVLLSNISVRENIKSVVYYLTQE